MRAIPTTALHESRVLAAGALAAVLASLLAPSVGRAQCAPVDIGTNAATAGTLAPGDCTLDQLGINIPSADMFFVDVYRVVLPSSGSLTVELNAANPLLLDTYLDLYDEAIVNEIAYGDDVSTSSNAEILDVFLDAGTYIILATSFDPGEIGSYTLMTSTSAGSNPACDVIVNVPANGVTQGTLSVGDCTLANVVPGEDTSYVDQYRVTLPNGGPVTVRLESSVLDSFLFLLDETRTTVIDLDDDGGGGSDSLLSNVALNPGSYVILANNYFPGDTGAYTLTLTPEPAPGLFGAAALAALLALSQRRRLGRQGR